MRKVWFALGLALYLLAEPRAQVSTAEQALSQKQAPLVEYEGTRHLEVEAGILFLGASGSIDVDTSQQGRVFDYKVTGESGNSYVRDYLRQYLNGEKDTLAKGRDDENAFIPENYAIKKMQVTKGGGSKLTVTPRREGSFYRSECFLYVNPSGEIFRSTGKVKSPSPSLYGVSADTQFSQINGIRMPISIKSTGFITYTVILPYTFTMTYRYRSVNNVNVR